MIAEKRIEEFTEVLASKAPVPGGGGASALVGAIGISLGNMVGSLTTGKKKYAPVEEEIQLLMSKSDELRKELLRLMDRDAEVFAPLAKAYSLPTETPSQREDKRVIMEQALYDASLVPLEIMRSCCEAIELCEAFAEKGSRLALSDAGVGVAFARAALQGAALNVAINTKAMENRTRAEELNREVEVLLDGFVPKADAVYEKVRNALQ